MKVLFFSHSIKSRVGSQFKVALVTPQRQDGFRNLLSFCSAVAIQCWRCTVWPPAPLHSMCIPRRARAKDKESMIAEPDLLTLSGLLQNSSPQLFPIRSSQSYLTWPHAHYQSYCCSPQMRIPLVRKKGRILNIHLAGSAPTETFK